MFLSVRPPTIQSGIEISCSLDSVHIKPQDNWMSNYLPYVCLEERRGAIQERCIIVVVEVLVIL